MKQIIIILIQILIHLAVYANVKIAPVTDTIQNDRIRSYQVKKGDVNGDGFVDIIVSRPNIYISDSLICDILYVYYGPFLSKPSLNSEEANIKIILKIDTIQAFDIFDINRDGFDDILVKGTNKNSKYLVNGNNSLSHTIILDFFYKYIESTNNLPTLIPSNDSLWHLTNLSGISVNVIASHPDGYLFAGVGDGIFKSEDNGESWYRVYGGGAFDGIDYLAINENGFLYASGFFTGLLFSSNNGGTWSSVGDFWVASLGMGLNANIFVGTVYDGVFHSSDYGQSWFQTSLTNRIDGFAVNSSGELFAVSSGIDGGIFRSSDNGNSWSKLLSVMYITSLAINSEGYIFATSYWSGVYSSFNNGNDWILLNGSPLGATIVIDDNDEIYVGAGFFSSGIFHSDDHGNNWIQIGLNNYSINSFTVNIDNFVYAATSGGVFRNGIIYDHDVGVRKIYSPILIVKPDSLITPSALIRNFGKNAEDIPVIFEIGLDYIDSTNITLDPFKQISVDFTEWSATTLGTFNVKCKTLLYNDEFKLNDSLMSTVVVSSGVGPEIYNVTPNHGGNIGNVTVEIFGSGFIPGANVKLTRSGQPDIVANSSLTTIVSPTKIQTTFSILDVALGSWNVVVKNPDENEGVFYNGFEIELTDNNLWVNLVGPNQIIINTLEQYFITIGNNGNTDAYGIPLWLAIPGNCDYQFSENLIPELDSLYNLDSIPLHFVSDSLFNIAINCKIIPIFICRLRPGESQAIEFSVKTSQTQPITLYYWLGNPVMGINSSNKNSTYEVFDSFYECVKDGLLNSLGLIIEENCLTGILSGAVSTLSGKNINNSSQIYMIARAVVGCIPIPWLQALVTAVDIVMNFKSCGEFWGDLSGLFWSNIPVIYSWDPNDKSGPIGYGEYHHLIPNIPMYYMIHFENVDTATASAQTVVLIDTLNTNLNWATLVFDTSSHVTSSQTFDTEKGIITWTFDGINLPPNVNPPEGEGWVLFHVNQKPDLPSGTQIINQASIKFDFNEPMLTGTVLNTIDAGHPSSYVLSNPEYLDSTSYLISWAGEDELGGSGIRNYTIYFSENSNGPFIPWKKNTKVNSSIFNGELNKTYYFYSIARDGVGHIEESPDTYDMKFTVTINEGDDNSLYIFPNPFTNHTTVRFNNPSHLPFQVNIYNLFGGKVFTIERISSDEIVLENLPLSSGIYIIELKGHKTLKGKMIINQNVKP